MGRPLGARKELGRGLSPGAPPLGAGPQPRSASPGGGTSAPHCSRVSRFLSGRSFSPLADPGPPGRELDCQRPLHLGLPVPEPALTRGPQPPSTQRILEGAPRCMPLPPLPASALLEGLPPPPFSPGPWTSPEGALFPEAFSPPNRLWGWAWSWGSQPSPPTSLADISCVFGADTLILKPGVPEGLHDPGVPPHHPALPGGNATTAVTGSGAVALSPQPRAMITSLYCTPLSRGPPQAPWGRREGRSPAGWRINLPWQAPLRASIFCRFVLPLPVGCGLRLPSGSPGRAGEFPAQGPSEFLGLRGPIGLV